MTQSIRSRRAAAVAVCATICFACSGPAASDGGNPAVSAGGHSTGGDLDRATLGGTLGTAGSSGGVGGTAGNVAIGGSSMAGASTAGDGGTSGAEPAPMEPTEGQRFLFEVAYENIAWGTKVNGVYITRDGEVYQYDYFDWGQSTGVSVDWAAFSYRPVMTEQQVSAKYGQAPRLLTQVSPQELLTWYAAVSSAQTGALVNQHACFDFGKHQYVAWIYDPANAAYSPVRLGTDGDQSVLNTHAKAQDLVNWLASLAGFDRQNSCHYRGDANCVQLDCGDSGAACAYASLVHASNLGCNGACVAPEQCPGAADCSGCGSTQVCVTGATGPLCTYAYCSTDTREVTCACSGDQLCAGGSAWCRGSKAEGFSCQAP